MFLFLSGMFLFRLRRIVTIFCMVVLLSGAAADDQGIHSHSWSHVISSLVNHQSVNWSSTIGLSSKNLAKLLFCVEDRSIFYDIISDWSIFGSIEKVQSGVTIKLSPIIIIALLIHTIIIWNVSILNAMEFNSKHY